MDTLLTNPSVVNFETGAHDFLCKQVFHIVNGTTRTPLRIGTEPNSDLYFREYELRSYLESEMPCEFGIGSYDDLKAALDILHVGVTHNGRDYRVLTGWVKNGDGATFVFVPKDSKVSMKDLKVSARLTKATDAGKFMKRLKRLCAMYRHAESGKFIAQTDDMMYYELGGRRWRMRVNDSKQCGGKYVIEGCSYFSIEWATAHLGPNPDREDGTWKVGDTFRGTITNPAFLWKGHGMVWHFTTVDAALFDVKTELTTDHVFVGFMGTLHSGHLRLNIQPVVNFGFVDLLIDLAIRAMDNMRLSLSDEDRFREMFMNTFGEHFAELDGDGVTAEQLNAWRTMAAIRDGFSTKKEAFIKRDVYRTYRKQLLDIENARVPVPKDLGVTAYYFFDPFTIGPDGKFYPERKRLSGNCVYCPKLKDGEETVWLRNPNAPHEYFITHNVLPPSGIRMIDPNAMIISIDVNLEFVGVQGGGDYDDLGNGLRGPFVEWFKHSLPYYPAKNIVAKASAKIREWFEGNPFAAAEGMDEFRFDVKMLESLIRAASEADAGMGMIINWLMWRLTLSLHRDFIVNDLKAQLCEYDFGYKPWDEAKALKILAALEQLEGSERYSEKEIAWDTEGAIDGLAMNGAKGSTDYNALGTRIRKEWDEALFVPEWMLFGGFQNNGRVPERCLNNDPVIVQTPICIGLSQLRKLREQLDDVVNAKQWLDMEPAPLAIRTYPTNSKIDLCVERGMDLWKKQVGGLFEKDMDEDEAYKAFIAICDDHLSRVQKLTPDEQMMFMAELERETHVGCFAAPKLFWEGHAKAGRPRPYPDAYLNNPRFFPLRRQLYKQEGLTRQLVQVPLYKPEYAEGRIQIEVQDGKVIAEDGCIIGLDVNIPNGAYSMVSGTVYVV